MNQLSEEALQRIATKLGSQCHVWEGVGARDIEEVLKLAREEAVASLPPLPQPTCTYADHSYPAFTKAQMTEYGHAARAGVLLQRQPQISNAIPTTVPLSKGRCLHGVSMSNHCTACARQG